MKTEASVARIIGRTIRNRRVLSALLILTIVFSIGFTILPPLVLEKIVDTLTAGEQILLSVAVGYFGITAVSGLLDAAKESLITAFGQEVTHQIRSAMSEKLKLLPASYFIEREPGVTASRFVNDVNTVDNLFTSGIISMAADLCKLLKAQMENRVAVGRTNQQIPETLNNMRTIRVLQQEPYMLERYGDTIEQSYRAQERSNFYDAVYSPIVVSISSLLIGIVMAASAQSGAVQLFFGMSAGTAAAMIAYVGNFFGPLESIGMEIQNVQSAVAGVRRINEFLKEKEQKKGTDQRMDDTAAVRVSDMSFRYHDRDQEIFHSFCLTVRNGESILLAGRTGAGKSTLIKLIAGLYQPQQGEVRVFGRKPDTIPENEKRRWFGYVEQQFRLVSGTVADQVSLFDSQVTDTQIRQALDLVGLKETVEKLPDGIHTLCTENLFSQGQFQLLSIARAVVLNPRILLLDEITANLDSQTEKMVLSALRAASRNRTVISVSHRLYDGAHDQHARVLNINVCKKRLRSD